MDDLTMEPSPDPEIQVSEPTIRLLRSGHFQHYPDHYTRRRRAGDYLLIWVVAGEGFARTQGRQIDAKAGHLLSFAAGRSHEYGSSTDRPWEIYWVHFDGPLAAGLFETIRRFASPRLDIGLDATLRELFEQLLLAQPDAATSPAPKLDYPHAAGDGLLHAVLGRIVHLLDTRRHQRPLPDAGPLDSTDLRRFIRQHIDQPMTLDELADRANLSVTHFSRLFREHFGVSPMRYVIDQRMAHAAQLLIETRSPVKQVAAALGYDDPYYFSRLFKRTTGLSPRQYRQTHQDA